METQRPSGKFEEARAGDIRVVHVVATPVEGFSFSHTLNFLCLRSACSSCKGFLAFLIAIGVFFVIVGGGGGQSSASSRLPQSGQASEHTQSIVDNNSYGNTSGDDATSPSYTNTGYEDQNLGYEEEQAALELAKEGEDDLENEKSLLSTAVSGLGSFLYKSVSSLLGGKASDEEINEIVHAVEAEVLIQASDALEEKEEEIVVDEINQLHIAVEQEEEEGVDAYQTERDIWTHEGESKAHIKTVMHSSEQDLESDLQERSIEAEKAILEKRLSLKLGKKVTLLINDDRDSLVDVDNMLEDLPNLRGSASNAGSSYSSGGSGYSSGSSGSGGYTSGSGGSGTYYTTNSGSDNTGGYSSGQGETSSSGSSGGGYTRGYGGGD